MFPRPVIWASNKLPELWSSCEPDLDSRALAERRTYIKAQVAKKKKASCKAESQESKEEADTNKSIR